MKKTNAKRTTIFLDENKQNFIKKIKKEKGLQTTTKVLEYLMDHHQNRLSNHIAKNIENLLLMFYLKASKKSINEENIEMILKETKKVESIKNKVLKKINDEKINNEKKKDE
jgi:hypothetical protein